MSSCDSMNEATQKVLLSCRLKNEAAEELVKKLPAAPFLLSLARSGEKIAQQGRSLGRQDRLGMKLDSLDIELPMLHAHDQAFVVGRRYFQTVR